MAPTREQARADMEYGLEDFASYFRDDPTFPIIPGARRSARLPDHRGVACIGTPDDCIRHFERLWLGSDGGFGAVLLLANNWADWAATKPSYELMARFFQPHFQRQSNTLRDRATTAPRPATATATRSRVDERGHDRDREVRKGQGKSLMMNQRSLAALGMTGCFAISTVCHPERSEGPLKPQ